MSGGLGSRLWRRLRRGAALLAVTVALLAVTLVDASPANAFWDRTSHTTPPWYSHAWYITTDTPGYFYNLGTADGQFDMQYLCNAGYTKDTMTVLDFGGIFVGGNGSYGNYATTMWSSPDEPLDHVVGAVESYAVGWYDHTTACPGLNIGIGTNSSVASCGKNVTCLGNAGTQWARVVNDVNTWLSQNGYQYQVHAYGAMDFESWSSTGYKDPSRAFVTNFSSASTGGELVNFGSADGCPTAGTTGCSYGWSQADYQYVSWYGVAWPLPENYVPSGVQANQWANIKKNYPMFILGTLSDTYYADPIPSWNDPRCAPVNCDTESYNQLWNRMNSLGIGQSKMDFLTNIRWA